MKIVCDSCTTKYSISDDKVRGKVFKIRCKKCSHIIVVRGNNEGAAAGQAPAAANEGGGWHLVVDGDQVGPLTDADVRGRLSRGEINGESFVWKDGFTDWVKLSTVSEFADEIPASGDAASAEGGADLMAESNGAGVDLGGASVASLASPANSGGLFGSISVAPAETHDEPSRPVAGGGFSAPSLGSDLGGGDLFAAQSSPRPSTDENGWGGGGGMSVSPGGHHDGGRVESLTAQRHENSVLFSLSNLQSLAAPGGAAKPAPSSSSAAPSGSEGSGLIDIRAMAATTLGSSSDGRGGMGDDLPSFGSFSPAAPVLLSLPTSSGPSKWVYFAVAMMVVLAGVIVLMTVKLLSYKPPVVAEAPPPAPVAAPVAAKANDPAAPAATPSPPPSTPVPEEKLPPREGAKPAEGAAAAVAAHGPGKKVGKRGARLTQADLSARPGSPAAAVAAAPAPEPAAPKAAKGSLDDLLDSALTGKTKPAKIKPDEDLRKPAAEPAASGALSKNAVVAGMNSVKGKISECYNQYKVPGMVMVTVVIGKNGKVANATATGKFAGTPSGTCVERAVKSAGFPPSDGLTTPYPFILK